MSNIYPYPWPVGTCHFRELPEDIKTELMTHVQDGALDANITVHQTPTEGPYISFAGWKVRAIIEPSTSTTWIAKLA